jgi:hypothetical protein
MSNRVKGCMGYLELLTSTYKQAPRSLRTLLSEATSDQLLCITEVILNTLEGNLRISTSPHLDLEKFKRLLRKAGRIVKGSTSATAAASNSGKSRNSRTTAASRKKLRELYVSHYRLLVEFLERCLPPLKSLLNGEEHDTDYEI